MQTGDTGLKHPLPARIFPGVEFLTPDFFTRDPVVCAKELIGSHFLWKGCVARIVETEAYMSVGDDACHTFSRPSAREFVASHSPGDAYVYLNYGVHWLFNILVKGGEGEGFVLLRSMEPVEGGGEMRKRRGDIPDRLLMAGPGRLTQALGIGGADHGVSFLTGKNRGILRKDPAETISGPRIGITKAADLPWRFGDPHSRCLSRAFSEK